METSKPDYKATLNLPQTEFPMKANLPQREPETLRLWSDITFIMQFARNQPEGRNLFSMTGRRTPTGISTLERQ